MTSSCAGAKCFTPTQPCSIWLYLDCGYAISVSLFRIFFPSTFKQGTMLGMAHGLRAWKWCCNCTAHTVHGMAHLSTVTGPLCSLLFVLS